MIPISENKKTNNSSNKLYIGFVNENKIFIKSYPFVKSHKDLLNKYPELKDEFFDSLAFRYRKDTNEWYFWDKFPEYKEKFLIKSWMLENFTEQFYKQTIFRKIMFSDSFRKSHLTI